MPKLSESEGQYYTCTDAEHDGVARACLAAALACFRAVAEDAELKDWVRLFADALFAAKTVEEEHVANLRSALPAGAKFYGVHIDHLQIMSTVAHAVPVSSSYAPEYHPYSKAGEPIRALVCFAVALESVERLRYVSDLLGDSEDPLHFSDVDAKVERVLRDFDLSNGAA